MLTCPADNGSARTDCRAALLLVRMVASPNVPSTFGGSRRFRRTCRMGRPVIPQSGGHAAARGSPGCVPPRESRRDRRHSRGCPTSW
jgi:hypothetical protein